MRTALVVGGTSGLGHMVASMLQRDMAVTVAARKPGTGDFPFIPCDVTKPEDRVALAKRFPKLDALVVTVGGFTGDIMDTNLWGPVAVAMELVPALSGGSVTMVSSTESAGDSEYGAAKLQLEDTVEEKAACVVGVRWNAVRPCAMRGGHAAPLPDDGRPVVDVLQVADAVCFLVRNPAVNGVILPVGGQR